MYHSTRELIAVREVLKDIYKHVLVYRSKVKLEYSTIHKYGQLPQSKVHEDNEACLKFSSLPKISSRTKHMVVPYHFLGVKLFPLK